MLSAVRESILRNLPPRQEHSELPPPLRGRVGEGGSAEARKSTHQRKNVRPPPPTPPRKGEGRCTEFGSHPSKTHVSFVPPPWLELTTSEPACRATRVRPPGTMRILSRPVSTNGRRSTWRGARPSSTNVGTVERASVGCAMKPRGSRLSFSRNASSVALSAFR